MCHTLQGLKVDISNRQLTVDFVNQSAIQSSSVDTVDSPRLPWTSDKVEFAERLGQMNKRYQRVSSDVIDRLKNLEMLELRWQEYEKNVTSLMNWFNDQDGKVAKYNRIGHEASIEQALKDCKVSRNFYVKFSACFKDLKRNRCLVKFNSGCLSLVFQNLSLEMLLVCL